MLPEEVFLRWLSTSQNVSFRQLGCAFSSQTSNSSGLHYGYSDTAKISQFIPKIHQRERQVLEFTGFPTPLLLGVTGLLVLVPATNKGLATSLETKPPCSNTATTAFLSNESSIRSKSYRSFFP
jgi:hypothetical protein